MTAERFLRLLQYLQGKLVPLIAVNKLKMKRTSVLILVILAFTSQAQNILHLEHDVELQVTIVEFALENHTIDTCFYDNRPYICKIDGLEWYGMDHGLELPKFDLKEIVFVRNEEKVNLDVSQMFNPAFSTSISERHFRAELINDDVQIYGWFSDGAGTYCAKWLVKDSDSKRILLSTSEEECFN